MAGPFRVPGTCLVGPVGRTLAGKGGAQLLHASSPPPPPTSESWQPTPRPSCLQLGLPSSVVWTYPPRSGPPCELTWRPENLTQWLPGVGEMNGEAQGIFRGVLLQMALFHSFYGCIISHCICIPYPLYPFICCWIFMLFPCLGYCKSCCYEQRSACIFLNYSFVRIYVQD